MRFLIKDTFAIRKEEKITLRDKKLIQLLINDGRAKVSELAKKLQISKSAVTQKIESLKKRGVLLGPVLYKDVSYFEKPMYAIFIQTKIGEDTEKTTQEILKIKGITAALWYNGTHNLILTTNHEDTQEILENLSKVVGIRGYRYARITKNYFNPPKFYDLDIGNKKKNLGDKNFILTKLDEKIVETLSQEPTMSILECSEKCKSAPITIKKRLEAMQKAEVIIGFSYYVNQWICGKELVSVNFNVLGKKATEKIIEKILTIKQTGNVWEFDHEWNINAVFYVNDQHEASKIIEKITKENTEINDIEVSVLTRMIGK